MENTCCPQYTIRLDALHFDPGKNKKMRYLLNRWKRFVMEGCKPGDPETTNQQDAAKAKGKKTRYVAPRPDGRHLIAKPSSCCSKPPQGQPYDYIKELHATEHPFAILAGERPAVQYEVSLVPAAATTERFELYKRYQEAVHNDKPGKNTISGFNRFLCKNPLGVSELYMYASTGVDAELIYSSHCLVETTHTLPETVRCSRVLAQTLWLLPPMPVNVKSKALQDC
jgi:arginine-tRNA-protein transferase